ncbi:hypothetical protein CENSYa_2051 [Cenarchaeum symbiosum A]|uniref:Uncharacterized protein n=1 Tax=Cenarchaeum symbiosum (strain A) TaxID=414004 RepID=A0RZ87_CENSY|nr:hypothetical protein CENSYa_2051 [Cenarchaeum symbiosum A]
MENYIVAKSIGVYNVVALILRANQQNPCGRTVIQKLTYFWSLLVSPINGVFFEPHYYGPYSSRLQRALHEMTSYAYLVENMTPDSVYRTYHYQLSNNGIELALRAYDMYKDNFEKIQKIINVCRDDSVLRAYELSLAAKIFYISDKMDVGKISPIPKNTTAIISAATKYGWNMTQTEVTKGSKILSKLTSMYPPLHQGQNSLPD